MSTRAEEKAARLEAFIRSIREAVVEHPECEPGFCVLAAAKTKFEIHIVSVMPSNLVAMISEELADSGGSFYVEGPSVLRRPN